MSQIAHRRKKQPAGKPAKGDCWLTKAIFQPAGRIVGLQKPFFSLRDEL
jgi:hypothetical protein